MYSQQIPAIMTRKECQELLHISKSSMLKLLKEGAIDSFTINGRYRITSDSLNEFIKRSVYF